MVFIMSDRVTILWVPPQQHVITSISGRDSSALRSFIISIQPSPPGPSLLRLPVSRPEHPDRGLALSPWMDKVQCDFERERQQPAHYTAAVMYSCSAAVLLQFYWATLYTVWPSATNFQFRYIQTVYILEYTLVHMYFVHVYGRLTLPGFSHL